MSKTEVAVCAVCGEIHFQPEAQLVFVYPDVIAKLPRRQRQQRVVGTDGACDLDRERHFLRGVLPLPVEGSEHPYSLGVWVEVPLRPFYDLLTEMESAYQARHPPVPARLANAIPLFPASTVGLAVVVQLVSPLLRPTIHVTDPCHSLHAEQQRGISLHRACEYAAHIP